MSRSVWTSFLRPSEHGRAGATATGADGVRVAFDDDIEAVDVASGLWNVPLGYGRPEITDAITRAQRDASYLTLFRRDHTWAITASERLLDFVGGEYSGVIHSTSGGAANDAMLKLARQFWWLRGRRDRTLVVGLRGSYHGLTHGAHSLSGEPLAQASHGIDQRSVRHIRFDDGGRDLEALLRREGDRVAAVIIEPVLGSGTVPVPSEFIDAVQRAREKYGFLLVADEVATGFHRTGPAFASGDWQHAPDILVLSKALTNGAAAAAALLVGPVVRHVFDVADAAFIHGETHAGAPSHCAAIIATLDLMQRDDLERASAAVAVELDSTIERLADHPIVVGHRGRGSFRSIEIAPETGGDPASIIDIVESIRRSGAIVHPGPQCLQLVPAAVMTTDDLQIAERAIVAGLDLELHRRSIA